MVTRPERVRGDRIECVVDREAVRHLTVRCDVSRDVLRETVLPEINRIESGSRVLIHGVPPCILPDAFELMVLDHGGVKTKACASCPLRDLCPGFPEEFLKVEADPQVPFSPALREVGIEVNRACHFKCPFCFYKNFYEHEDKGFVAKERILGLLSEMARSGVSSVRFFGGDPVLRSDMPELVEFAKARGLFVIINTNGLFRDEASRERIVASADSLIISLHGHDERSESVLTGRGDLFKPVLASIRRLCKEAPRKVMVASLVTRYLLDDRERYLSLLSRVGVLNWSLNRPMFTPAEAKEFSWLSMGDEELRGLISWVKAARVSSGINIVMNNMPLCFVEDEDRHVIAHNAQTNSLTRLFFDVEGHFKPGPANHIEGPDKYLDLGGDLATAWERNPYKEMGARALVPAECKSCSAYMRCVGGSRVQALWATGRLDGRDPLMVGPIAPNKDRKDI